MGLLGNPINRLPVRGRKQWATNLLLASLATEFLGSSMLVPIMAQYAASFDVDKGLVGLVFSVSAFSTLLSDLWYVHLFLVFSFFFPEVNMAVRFQQWCP